MIGAATKMQTEQLEGETGNSNQAWEVLPRPRTLWLEEGGTSGQNRQFKQRRSG